MQSTTNLGQVCYNVTCTYDTHARTCIYLSVSHPSSILTGISEVEIVHIFIMLPGHQWLRESISYLITGANKFDVKLLVCYSFSNKVNLSLYASSLHEK